MWGITLGSEGTLEKPLVEINGGMRSGHELALLGMGIALPAKPVAGEADTIPEGRGKRVNRRENR